MLQPRLSCSIDDISVKLLKIIKTEIYKPITLIINQMLVTGIFPDKLKLFIFASNVFKAIIYSTLNSLQDSYK